MFLLVTTRDDVFTNEMNTEQFHIHILSFKYLINENNVKSNYCFTTEIIQHNKYRVYTIMKCYNYSQQVGIVFTIINCSVNGLLAIKCYYFYYFLKIFHQLTRVLTNFLLFFVLSPFHTNPFKILANLYAESSTVALIFSTLG